MLIPIIKATGVTRDALSVVFADQTGAYSLTTNPGGYGIPNVSNPVAVGFRFRNWNQIADYYNVVSADTTLISELLSVSGHKFNSTLLGLSPYRAGVHHIRYYPFEPIDTVVNLTQNSKVITVVSGTAPNTYNAAYKAIIILDGTGKIITNVLLIDPAVAATSTTFAVTVAWTLPNATNYTMKLATEADLKVVLPQLADGCINKRIGNLSTKVMCDRSEIDILTRLLLWKFSAQIKFDCKDYTGADDILSATYDECNNCPSNICKTC